MRVADWHTYFVGHQEWGWCVWAHNAKCFIVQEDGKFFLIDQKSGQKIQELKSFEDVRSHLTLTGDNLVNAPRVGTSFPSDRKMLEKFRQKAPVLRKEYEIGKGVTKNVDTQNQIRNAIDDIVTRGEKRVLPYDQVPDADWFRIPGSDLIVVRKPNGEFISILERSKGGSADRWIN